MAAVCSWGCWLCKILIDGIKWSQGRGQCSCVHMYVCKCSWVCMCALMRKFFNTDHCYVFLVMFQVVFIVWGKTVNYNFLRESVSQLLFQQSWHRIAQIAQVRKSEASILFPFLPTISYVTSDRSLYLSEPHFSLIIKYAVLIRWSLLFSSSCEIVRFGHE